MGFNKKVLSKAVSELDKAKAPAKPRDITVDPMGYWNLANQGKPVRVPGGDDINGMYITMHQVSHPIWAQPNVGPGVIMYPEENRHFSGASYVDEIPIGKKGGTLKSKKYSKSISATNKLFVKNKLFQKKKSKIFDPNAEFKSGGSKLGPINLDPNPLSHYELNYGFNLPTQEIGGENEDEYMDLTDEEIQAYRDGGYVVEELPEAQEGGPQNTLGPRAEEIPTDVDAMNAMMKARMATDAEFGNPAAQRMTSPNPKTYDFGNGNLGTHFMASMGNQAVPLLQDKGGDELEYNENPPPSKEDMNFRTPEEAQYFAEHYKEVAPMMKGFKEGGYVQHELVKAQNGKTVKTFKRDIRDQDAQSNTGWGTAPVQKKKVQPTAKQKQAQKSFDKNFKVTDKSKYEKTEDKIVNEQQKLKDWAKETGRTISDEDLKSVADQQWSFAGVGPQKQPDMMQATPEQSNSSRAWEYVTNPFTAAEYAISGGGAENMPHNINEMRMAGVDPGVVQGRNLVGNTLNSTVNLLDAGDKVVRNTARGNYGEAALEAMRFIPGGGLLDDAVRLGLKPGVKALGKTFNTTKGKLAKFIPERAPGTPSTGGGNLNAGISPELITNFVGAKNKVGAKFLDNSYFNLLGNKTVNKISPLNWVPGYGKKLEGVVKPMGNVIGSSIDNGNIVNPTSLIKKAKGLVKKSQPTQITTKVGKTNAGDIYSARFDDAVEGSNIKLGEGNKQGVIGRTFKTAKTHNVQNKLGENLTQVPLSDPGVALNRRLPFSNRYVPIDKEKLMNNKFQWSTTGAGAQKLAEKFGAATAVGTIGGLGTAGAAAYNYNPLDYYSKEDRAYLEKQNTPLDQLRPNTSRSDVFLNTLAKPLENPVDYLASPDPYFIGTAGEAVYGKKDEYKQGGIIEEAWEDELDEHTIALLRKAGYIVKELD